MAFTGGRGVQRSLGTIYAGNIAPDLATGISAWSEAVWGAMRERGGRASDTERATAVNEGPSRG